MFLKKHFLNQSGFTLLELLATVVISGFLISVIYGVFNTSIKYDQKVQSHVNLRQEANIIISKLKQLHQGGVYNLCSDSLISNNNIYFSNITLDNNGTEINLTNKCQNINPTYDLNVHFTLADNQNNQFEVNTVIEPSVTVAPNINIGINVPSQQSQPNFYSILSNIFIYGNQFSFQGSQVNGPNATMVVNGTLSNNNNNINGGSLINVSNIYINGSTYFDNGSASLGSNTNPGNIYINGNLSLLGGNRDVYGNVYVNGNFSLKDASIHGNVFVNGNVTLDWTPSIDANSRIYYTGSLTAPNSYSTSILSKMIKQPSVPGFTMPIYDIPPLKSDSWYTQNGYVVDDGTLGNNKKIFSKTNFNFTGHGNNIIIASKGDININDNWSGGVTGVLYAPNGKVTFNGDSFTGVIIAKNGFQVTSGGTNITFSNINSYISNSSNYPF